MRRIWIAVLFLLLPVLISCIEESPTTTRELWKGVVRIGDILSSPSSYKGKEVEIVGYYRGWDLFGEAGCGPPLTRSDIALADATGGIYVVEIGRIKGIQDLNPSSDPYREDLLFKVRGIVRISTSGHPYIEAIDGKQVEGLPVGVVLKVRRVGGIAGFDEELMAMEEGRIRYLDRKAKVVSDISVAKEEISKALEIVGRLPSGEIGAPIPDGFSYVVTSWKDGGLRTSKIHEVQLPQDAVELKGLIGGWFSKAREPAALSP